MSASTKHVVGKNLLKIQTTYFTHGGFIDFEHSSLRLEFREDVPELLEGLMIGV